MTKEQQWELLPVKAAVLRIVLSAIGGIAGYFIGRHFGYEPVLLPIILGIAVASAITTWSTRARAP